MGNRDKMGNSRESLKELCDRMGYTMKYISVQTGPSHSPTFSCNVNIVDKNEFIVMTGHGSAKRLRIAQEAACRSAMHATPPPIEVHSERSYARLGDAGAEFLLAMLAHSAGISAAMTDSIRQKCFANERLAETSAATVGQELSAVIDTILPIIEAAIKIGNPQLVDDVHLEVIRLREPTAKNELS